MIGAEKKLREAAKKIFYTDRFSVFRAQAETDGDGYCRSAYPQQATFSSVPCLICSADGLFNLATKNKSLVANRPGYEQFRIICSPEVTVVIGDRVSCEKNLGRSLTHLYTGVVQKAAYYATHLELLVTNERLI